MSARIDVTVIATRGSSPREPGAQLRVWQDRTAGTVGGGALEWEATALARQMLADGTTELTRVFALGPELGQCCGGQVTLQFARDAHAWEPTNRPFWIWGAGHVGRAIARTLSPFEDRPIVMVDDAASRLPDPLPEGVDPLVAADMPLAATHAPDDAHHLILTYSHAIDLALCDALLRHGFSSCGLIGSATKWARFRNRLAAMGHSERAIGTITCPIGNPALGKHPQAIAIGVAMAMLQPGYGAALGDKAG